MTTLNGERWSRSGAIEDIRRALQEAQSGADVDAIERLLDAMQEELRATWSASETRELTTSA